MGYQIKVDGSLLYASDADENHIVLNPTLTLETGSAGSLTFVLPPGNVMHNGLQKLKHIITVDHDGERLFRGRVLETNTDMYKQQDVYCEGQKSFLLDSQMAPYTYSGTVHGLYNKLIDNHNAKVDASKRFTAGTIDVVPESETVEVESRFYESTNGEIESRLLGAYGGYLRERQDGTTRYLDWVKQYGAASEQPIEFAVNLLDLQEKASAKDVFTVLIPLGAVQVDEKGDYTDPLTVASVNGGLNYIEDEEAVALYGRIERSYTWDHVEDAAKLLEKGKEHLKTGVALQTLTLKAVDMHFVDPDIKSIRLGDMVHIVSNPHGIDITMMCSKIVIDLANPEKTEYTFGEEPKTLTDNVVNTQEEVSTVSGGGGGRAGIVEETEAILRWAAVNVEQTKAQVQLVAWDVNELTGKQTMVEIRLDGIEGTINLKADKEYVDSIEERVGAAEVDINAAEAAIKLKANQTTVDKLSGRVTEAEASLVVQAGQISSKVEKNGVISSINQTAEEITIQAKRVNMSGYVTASQLSAEIATINNFFSGVSEISVLKATMVNCTSTMLYKGEALSLKSMTVTTPTGTATISYVGH